MVRLYLGELVATACPALGAQSWLVKAQGAAAVAAIAEKMGKHFFVPSSLQFLVCYFFTQRLQSI